MSKYKWYAAKDGARFYVQRAIYNPATGKQRSVRMHNDVLKVPKGKVCDHKNRNGLDNRLVNLRAASSRENGYNQSKGRRRSSKYRGVSRDKKYNKWRVIISYGGKRKDLGYFEDELEAARAYDKAAKKYHGEFASLNFPPTEGWRGIRGVVQNFWVTRKGIIKK
jgi:hypothetical protein